MLDIIKDLPSHVIGIRAKGEVTGDDYQRVLLPALETAAKINGELNFLMVLETDIKNFTAGAWLNDLKAGQKHFSKWNRMAIVSPQKTVDKFTDVISIFIPGESKGFLMEELEMAIKWVSGLKV